MLEAIIEFLTNHHNLGRRSAYGWVYVLLIASMIFGGLTAREIQQRRERLLTSTRAQALTGPLHATAVVEQAGSSCLVEGEFRSACGRYELVLGKAVDGTRTESTHAFSTIEELEGFLEANTVLRLSDFRA